FRQGDACGIDPVIFRCPKQEPAPTRANIEKALAFAQPKLSADMIELRFLGFGQSKVGLSKITAGIHATRIKPKSVKVVGNVVVKLNLLGITSQRMSAYRPQVAHEAGEPVTLGHI